MGEEEADGVRRTRRSSRTDAAVNKGLARERGGENKALSVPQNKGVKSKKVPFDLNLQEQSMFSQKQSFCALL